MTGSISAALSGLSASQEESFRGVIVGSLVIKPSEMSG